MTGSLFGVLGLWGLFAGTHTVLSSRGLRPRLVARLGEPTFLGLYSLVALASFVPLVWLYLETRHQGALLWALPLGTAGLWALYAGQAVAWTLVVAGLVNPSPATVGLPAERRPRDPRGVHRLTRHPLFMGLGLAGLLHLPANGFATDVAFWAGFPLFAWLGCAHQDARKALEQPGYAEWIRATPFLPFTGSGTLRGLRELRPSVLAAGLVLTITLRLLHAPLFR
ncbi:MAG: NnrU family protein [Myxococcota bacterium]|nr:NnrU family protein [Myxococcota bacterium]